MHSVRKFAISIALLLAVLAANALAQAMFPQPFTADMAMKTKGGEQVTGKYYVGADKMRMDMDTHGQSVSTIVDPATKTSYMVMHSQKMYMEMHAGQQPMMQRGPKMPDMKSFDPNNPCANDPNVTCKDEGSETVNGRSAEKWVFTDKKNGQVTTTWVDKKLHFPLRTLTSDGTEMNLTNIQEGAVPASTFAIPAGYRKLDMGAMMGGHMPQQ
jgi:outer membrane lipoprotein-sorting protein